MTDWSIIYVLAAFTLVAALAIGAWQLRRVKKADRRNDHSAFTGHGGADKPSDRR